MATAYKLRRFATATSTKPLRTWSYTVAPNANKTPRAKRARKGNVFRVYAMVAGTYKQVAELTVTR
jgi:hypothetical protein